MEIKLYENLWLSRSLNRPIKLHLNAAKNLFKYLNSTKDYSICFSYNGNTVANLGPKLSNSSNITTKLSRDFYSKEGPRPLTTTSTTIVDSRNGKGSSRTSIINNSLVPIGFSNSDFTGDKATSKSTYSYLYKLAGRPISWKTKRATTIALSTLEAETNGLIEAIRKVQWIIGLFSKLYRPIDHPITLYRDNQGSIIVANNPALYARTKHTLLKFRYVREQVKAKIVTIIYLNTNAKSCDAASSKRPRLWYDELPISAFNNPSVAASPPAATMGSTQFGNFDDFCAGSTLPVCNLLSTDHDQAGPWQGCELKGIPLSGGRNLGNLGSILLCVVAIVTSGYLLFLSERKRAAVGRREMQLFLLGYIVISICEIFSVGEFPLASSARIAFSSIHIGFIVATTWILMLNAVVGYQLLDDGTPASLGLLAGSGLAFLIGTGYIALDTGFQWTRYWNDSYELPNRHIALYVLYQLAPLIFLVIFYVLEAILVLRVLGETRPMLFLTGAAVFFALGQIFNYVVSSHICNGTLGKIDGAMFETMFTLASVVMIWIFWSSITEDDWPMPVSNTDFPWAMRFTDEEIPWTWGEYMRSSEVHFA
ncbi:hypothetical protein P8C59_000114 [Phyllachora maydis]|uniref:Chitin synthase export chaperone n=1 Tax=Phyllachora maydis TaxID=1825666 RepID=A0AAD9M5X6_9PEZI|nr:hypothetical protein P8C59_000114 [Phyllachora maydis]